MEQEHLGAEEEAVGSHHIPSPPALLFGHTPQSSRLPAYPQLAVHPLVLGCGGLRGVKRDLDADMSFNSHRMSPSPRPSLNLKSGTSPWRRLPLSILANPA